MCLTQHPKNYIAKKLQHHPLNSRTTKSHAQEMNEKVSNELEVGVCALSSSSAFSRAQ